MVNKKSGQFSISMEERMKRLACLSLLVLMVLQVSCKKKEKEIERIGIVNFLAGTVKIESDGSFSDARVGDKIRQGMKIQTDKKSFVEIYFDSYAIKILENSSVEISRLVTKLNDKSDETEFYVEEGKLFSRVSKKLMKNEKYSVKTPTTVAGVRGTDFMVTEEDGKAKVACLEGLVDVLNRTTAGEETVDIKGGQEVVVEKDKEMEVTDISESAQIEMQNIIRDFKQMREDIRKNFENERRKINEMFEEEKRKYYQNVEDVKKQANEDVDKLTGEMDEEIDKLSPDAMKGDQKAKKATDEMKKETEDLVDSVKQDIPSFDTQ